MITCDKCGAADGDCFVFRCRLDLKVDVGTMSSAGRYKDGDVSVPIDLCMDCAKESGQRLRTFIKKGAKG